MKYNLFFIAFIPVAVLTFQQEPVSIAILLFLFGLQLWRIRITHKKRNPYKNTKLTDNLAINDERAQPKLVQDTIRNIEERYPGLLVMSELSMHLGGPEVLIDGIIVSNRGIFVLNMKNYGAVINGDSSDSQWSAKYKNGSNHSFKNPLIESKQYIKSLKHAMKTVLEPQHHEALKSIIVFPDNAILPSNLDGGGDCKVLRTSELMPFLDKCLSVKNNECIKVNLSEKIMTRLFEFIYLYSREYRTSFGDGEKKSKNSYKMDIISIATLGLIACAVKPLALAMGI